MNIEDVKLYLRVDTDDEDTLIQSLITTAQNMVEDILRFKLSEYTTVPEVINQAMLLIVATLHESRQIGNGNELKINELTETVRRMIEPYRKVVW